PQFLPCWHFIRVHRKSRHLPGTRVDCHPIPKDTTAFLSPEGKNEPNPVECPILPHLCEAWWEASRHHPHLFSLLFWGLEVMHRPITRSPYMTVASLSGAEGSLGDRGGFLFR